MVQMSSLDFQHFYQFIILLKDFVYFLNTFIIPCKFPREIGIFIAYKAEDLEDRRTISFNKRSWEIGNRNSQKIRIKISIDIIDCI
jgi:hypothetical protein